MVGAFREQRDLALENLALRQQLGVLKRRGFRDLSGKTECFGSCSPESGPSGERSCI